MPQGNKKDDRQFSKLNEKEMEVVTPVTDPIKQTLSYDRILNDIQECEERLVYLNQLKAEADKFGLKR